MFKHFKSVFGMDRPLDMHPLQVDIIGRRYSTESLSLFLQRDLERCGYQLENLIQIEIYGLPIKERRVCEQYHWEFLGMAE